MDEEDEPQGHNPVVRVPAFQVDGSSLRPAVVDAPLDVATQWDERIWGHA
ncbi:hypothetical protein [Streptomyces coeruleorubidus]|nr:hypothetical protein [Streptomyces coeruleorubidus]GGT86486.1 hypothetical protein GCM10010256_53420 [Streptomyces coeruleorubidus]